MNQSVIPLRIANEAFLVASTIERCPKTMMLRELVSNALEAAAQDTGAEGRVEIGARRIGGVRKLCIWNTGPGLAPDQLRLACDLASSIGKANGLDANFGMGAKVASLPSNRFGMRFRSCATEMVSEVVMGERGGVYGRLPLEGATDGPGDLRDVTTECAAEGWDLTQDWTEVTLFGNRPDQDTVADPYDGNPRQPRDWLPAILLRRFATLPGAMRLTLLPDVVGAEQPATFEPLPRRLHQACQTELVAAGDGVSLLYALLPADLPPPPGLPGGCGAIMHRGEIYDVVEASRWALDAPSYGIAYGAARCFVLVQLDDDSKVRPEAYRQFLRHIEGHQDPVQLRGFAPLIRRKMPAWLARQVGAGGLSAMPFGAGLTAELLALLEALAVRPPEPVVLPSLGLATPQPGPVIEEAPAEPVALPPMFICLDDPALIEERGLSRFAARYYADAHEIYINLRYPAVLALANELERHAVDADADRLARRCADVAGWMMTRRLTRGLVFSMAKLGLWHPHDIGRAQTAEALSLLADDWWDLLPLAREKLAMASAAGLAVV
jgi:hypothetical protein